MRGTVFRYRRTLLQRGVRGDMKVSSFVGAFIIASFFFIGSCATDYGVIRVSENRWFRASNESALNSGELSVFSSHYLDTRGFSLLSSDEENLINALVEAKGHYIESGDPASLFALAEISYELGDRFTGEDQSHGYYLGSAVSAYEFLFGKHSSPELFDPRKRLAIEIYNFSIAHLVEKGSGDLVRELLKEGGIGWTGSRISLHEIRNDLFWKLEEYKDFEVAYSYRVKGLKYRVRSYGIGAPLIARINPELVRKKSPYLPGIELAIPAVFILKPQDTLRESFQREKPINLTWHIVDPQKTRCYPTPGQCVPLESDYTIPLAMMIEKAPSLTGSIGLLFGELWEKEQGLYMIAPYDPDRIPVVFVHGLNSSPYTWVPMVNELMNDPEIRKKYQFWFYLYPSSYPILYSASGLRDSLRSMAENYRTDRSKKTFDQMVLVGHSMGGILSRMMVVSSGSKFWNISFKEPIESLDVSEDRRDRIRSLFFFQPLSFVRRVVFLNTPHRGSDLATAWYGQAVSYLLETPKKLLTVWKDLYIVTGDILRPEAAALAGRPPTSIDNLSPRSSVLRVLSSLELSRNAVYHSIIGNTRGTFAGGSDSVVPYESSHIDEARSEKIIQGGHTVHKSSQAAAEVLRILKEDSPVPDQGL